MHKLLVLFGDIIYNNIQFTVIGFSGGSKMFPPKDFIPDSVIYLHRIILN